MIANRTLRAVAAAGVAVASLAAVSVWHAPAANALAPVNPVRVDLAGHPANSGFLVYVEGDVGLNADESEGTLAAGGNLSFNSTYNVAAHTPKDSTFTAPGDAGPTYLYVGGGMAWHGSQVLRVLNSGFTKIADDSTYTARNKDQNNATVNYRVVKPGAAYDSTPRIEGTTSQQSPASISTPVPSSLIDMAGAFALYRHLTTELAGCPTNVELTDPNGGSAPITQPYAPGARGRLTLTPGKTNVLQMSTTDLANLSEITFTNQPNASTPLVVNVTGGSFTGHCAQPRGHQWQSGAVHSLELSAGLVDRGHRRSFHRGDDLRPERRAELASHPEHRGQRHRGVVHTWPGWQVRCAAPRAPRLPVRDDGVV